jgi:ferric iron reductase protein FhuF
MNNFIIAFREFLDTQKIKDAKPRLVWGNNKFFVTWYYAEETILKNGWEVICG